MTVKLFVQAIIKYLLGVVLAGAAVFIPAGTLQFFNGWLFMGVLFVPMLFVGMVMMYKNPDLLQKRLAAKEQDSRQGLVVTLSGLMFIVGFAVAGLDFRFGWCPLPQGVAIAAAVVFLLGYTLYALVLKQNTYLSRTVAVQAGQKVVDTGLYGIVRHPMYSATLLLFLAMPLVLGSVCALVVFLAYPFLLIKRIRHEEALLERELEGYTRYMQKVKYRLIPFVW